MRKFMVLTLAVGMGFMGCAHHKAGKSPGADGNGASATPGRTQTTQAAPKTIVIPDRPLVGKVAKVNSAGRFVVLTFPVGHLPSVSQQLNLYRGGLKVAEVKVDAHQYDDNVVADIMSGEAEVGDEARDK
jgi:hypothetical protein